MEEIIDFATWYSGMEREKVERAYQRYLREVKHLDKESNCNKPLVSNNEVKVCDCISRIGLIDINGITFCRSCKLPIR